MDEICVIQIVCDFSVSFLGSLVAIYFIYFWHYWRPVRRCKTILEAEAWWLPGWNCCRFVIRNMHRKDNVLDIRCRAFLREILPQKLGSSVKTFADMDIALGERILLAGEQDFPIICFRFEHQDSGLKFIHTDKKGVLKKTFDVRPELEALTVEYYLRIKRGFLLKHEISRLYQIPHYLEKNGTRIDYFEKLLEDQSKPEHRIEHVFKREEFITVTI